MKYSSRKVIDVLNKIKFWSHSNLGQEICGFLGKKEGRYIVELGNNIAQDPRNYFCLDPVQYLLFKSENELVCCFHSHIMGNEEFSEFDIKMSENSCLPFLVYSLNTQKFNIYCPQNNDSDVNILDKIKEKV
jgi:proteasome lid subunit RPN8/RPN11